MARLARAVTQQLEKARASALCAVDNYNRPGRSFRTRTFAILMVVAWTALFHAIFYRRKTKPWYVASGSGRGIRYVKVEGEPKHWELRECLKEYFQHEHPPERRNIEFMFRLRNKIEHRDHPELDPALYGECQANLMNFEDLLSKEFGKGYALAESLAVSLQFSVLRPEEQREALKRLEKSSARDLLEFVKLFRADLPPEILESTKYSLKFFLLPKLANREKAADLAVEFVHYDSTRPQEMEELKKVAALIKERRVPIASEGLLKPGEVVDRLRECLPFEASMYTHTQAWKHYKVRPEGGSVKPEDTRSDFCVYDHLMGSYGYTEAWVGFLCRKLANPNEYLRVTGKQPIAKLSLDTRAQTI